MNNYKYKKGQTVEYFDANKNKQQGMITSKVKFKRDTYAQYRVGDLLVSEDKILRVLF